MVYIVLNIGFPVHVYLHVNLHAQGMYVYIPIVVYKFEVHNWLLTCILFVIMWIIIFCITIISNVKFEIDCNFSKFVVTIVDVYDFNTIWTCIFDSPYHTIYKAGLEILASWQRGQETLQGREHCVFGQSQQQRSHCCHRNHGKDINFHTSPKWVKNSFSGM